MAGEGVTVRKDGLSPAERLELERRRVEEVTRRATKEEFRAPDEDTPRLPGTDRAYLRARTEKLDIEGRVGTTKVLQNAREAETQSGWFCEVCNVIFKDSVSYLDHINSKRRKIFLHSHLKAAHLLPNRC